MSARTWLTVAVSLMALTSAGCGGGSGSTPSSTANSPAPPSTAQAGFVLSAPSSVTVTPGSTQTITLAVQAENGFSSPVQVAISGLPSGVAASPASFTLTPAASGSSVTAPVAPRDNSSTPSQTVTITAGTSAASGPISMTVTGTSGAITQSAVTVTNQADFALAAATGTVLLSAGSSTQISVSADAFNGFSGPVAISISGLPATVTASPSTFTVTPGTAQAITLSASSSAAAGAATISLAGNSGDLSHNLEVSLAVTSAAAPPAPDFSFSVLPVAVTLQAGGGAQQVTISAVALNGFVGTIDFTLSGLPAGVAAAPATLSLMPGQSAQISLNAASTALSGTANLTVQATSGTIAHTAQVALMIQAAAPAFTLAVNPNSVGLTAGGAPQQVSITANAVGAFTSPVNVTLAGLPAGVTVSPSSFTLTPGISQSVSVQAASSAIADQSSITVQAISGALSSSATLSLTVAAAGPDFQLFAGPSTLNISTSSVQSLTIALIPLNGFNGVATVSLSGLPSGVTLVNQPLPLVANIPQTIQLSAVVSTPTQAPITITAVSGSIIHTAQVNLVVTNSTDDFIPFLFAGSNANAATPIPGLLLSPGTFTFTIEAPEGITVQLSGMVPGAGLDQSQYTFSSNTDQAVFNITVTTAAVGERGVLQAVFTGGAIGHEVDLPIYVVAQPTTLYYVAPLTIEQGQSAAFTAETASTSTAPQQFYVGPGWPQGFSLSGSGVTATASTPLGAVTLPLQFAGVGISQIIPLATQVIPYTDFQISAEPTTIALNAGAVQTVAITAAAVNGFSAPVEVSLDNLPSGVQATPQLFSLAPGSTETVTIAAGAGYANGGPLTIDGTSGTLVRSTQIAVSPGSFTGDLAVTGSPFSVSGLLKIYNSGTYQQSGDLFEPSISGVLTGINSTWEYLSSPDTAGEGIFMSNCGGIISNPDCTPIGLLVLGQENTNSPQIVQGTIPVDINSGAGDQLAIVPFEELATDYSVSFSPPTLTVAAGSSAQLSMTPTTVSPTITDFCETVSPEEDPSSFLFSTTLYNGGLTAQILAAPPIGAQSPATYYACSGIPMTVSVPADVPPGNYELTVVTELTGEYNPNYDPSAVFRGLGSIAISHTYGVPITVTAASNASTPSDDLSVVGP